MNKPDFKIEFFGETNQGMVRQNNEDCFIVQYIWDKKFLLCAAIDGMGGYEGGEVAADIARTTLLKNLDTSPDGDVFGALKQAFVDANNEIVRYRQASPMYSSMGCVATVGLFDLIEPKLYLVHVGDSRLYRYQLDKLEKLSHDHSLVGYREEIGDLTESEAMKHPNRSVISRSVGDNYHQVEDDDFLETSIFPIFADSEFLFCSDGLSDMVYSQQIASVLSSKKPVKDQVKELIEDANNAGGKDNVTVVIVRFTHINYPEQEKQENHESVSSEETTTESSQKKSKNNHKNIWIAIISCLFIISAGLCLWLYLNPIYNTQEAITKPVPNPSIAVPDTISKESFTDSITRSTPSGKDLDSSPELITTEP